MSEGDDLASLTIYIHHDLFNQRPHNSFLQTSIALRVIPHGLELAGQVLKLFPCRRCDLPSLHLLLDPLFNFLVDRPNPTRFNHFIAGALTPADMQEVIRDLDRAKPRYILWDHGGVVYFQTDLTNRPLSDYIWGCYHRVASFTSYLILERRCR